jgi:hypothetical protein
MSLSRSSVDRFRQRVDAVLEDFFPVSLVIDGVTVLASGPGGRITTEFQEAGQQANFRYSFRVKKTAVPTGWLPKIGAPVGWELPDGPVISMEIREISTRPHEDRFAFACQHRRK